MLGVHVAPFGATSMLGWSILRAAREPILASWNTGTRNSPPEVSAGIDLATRSVCTDGRVSRALGRPRCYPGPMVRKYSGNKKSIEARSGDDGRTWSVKLYDSGRLTEYSGGTLAEVDALAVKHQMTLDR